MHPIEIRSSSAWAPSLRALGLLTLAVAVIGLTGCSVCCTVHECCPRPCAPADRIGIDLPDAVHAGVLQTMPGFVASEIEVESKDGKPVYELEGRWNGSTYEILVDGDGNVLQVDEEDEDEDEGDTDGAEEGDDGD